MLKDLGKLIVSKGFKKLPRVQKIARSGHTGDEEYFLLNNFCHRQTFIDSLDKPRLPLDGKIATGNRDIGIRIDKIELS